MIKGIVLEEGLTQPGYALMQTFRDIGHILAGKILLNVYDLQLVQSVRRFASYYRCIGRKCVSN